MNKENKILPELRFPEFQKAGSWEIEPFSVLYSFFGTNSFTRDNLNYNEGSVKNIHYGDIHTKFSTLFDITKEIVPFVDSSLALEKIKLECYCKEGDVIFADASEDMKDVGKSIEIINLNNEKLLSGLHTLLARQKKGKLRIGFSGHLFMSPNIRTQIQREAQGAKVLGISATRLSNINVFYPIDKKEQQKIASCLSSLDELMAAETQKLDALKDHKKGLMQQLFPAEGETVPKLRFKEFENSGEWKEMLLRDAVNFYSGGTPSKDIKEFWDGEIPWISASSMHETVIEKSDLNITDLAVKNGASIAKKGVLLILVRGSMLFKRIPICITTRDVAFNQDVKSLDLKKDIINLFFLYLLISHESNLLETVSATGIGAGKLDTEDLKKLVIHVPLKQEQLKIASCLSSLDEQIAAQAQKIEALKEHKKGLMQGLFPSITNYESTITKIKRNS